MNEFCDVCGALLETNDEKMDKLCEDCLKEQLMECNDESYEELNFNDGC